MFNVWLGYDIHIFVISLYEKSNDSFKNILSTSIFGTNIFVSPYRYNLRGSISSIAGITSGVQPVSIYLLLLS